MALEEAYRTGLEVIRKEYKATMRNRAGKMYITVNWADRDNWMPWNDRRRPVDRHFDKACKIVEQIWPGAYITSASVIFDVTFRLNP